jgi:hypothetical protein
MTTLRRRRWDRLRICCAQLCWLRIFSPALRAGGRLHRRHRARRTTVQPTQLSLLPDQLPPPPAAGIDHLPDPQVQAATVLLARLIAKAAETTSAAEEEAGDE